MMKRYICCIFLLLFLYPLLILAAPLKKPETWTLLVFLNGKNDLDDVATEDLKRMEAVGSNDNLNIIVQWASIKHKKTRRLKVEKSKDPDHITSPILEDLGSVDMGSYKSLQDFIHWGIKNFPADHYFIDVWDHGGGWQLSHLPKFKNDPLIMGNISYDDETHHAISTEELGRVMDDAAKLIGHKVDIYGSDACYMGMVEVASEMDTSVKISIGSEAGIPDYAWPYKQFLKRWEASPNFDGNEIAYILADEYAKYYENYFFPVTLSAFDLEKLADLSQSWKKLNAEIILLTPKERERVITIITNMKNFSFLPGYYKFYDMGDFLTHLKEANIETISQDTLNEVLNKIQKFVVVSKTTGIFNFATGATIWITLNSEDYKKYRDRYQNLVFNRRTQWNETLDFLIQGTH